MLIGVSEYRQLGHLPAVARNVDGLRRALTDAELWGLPEEHCVVLLDPPSGTTVLEALHQAAQEATEALVVYFAGHGLLNARSDLFLAMGDSSTDRLFTAINYDSLRHEVVETARACYAKVVILDCCYSGRALQGGMGGLVEMADHARVDGTYLMTASAETSVALAPPGEDYTAFTGVFLNKLTNGLRDGPDLLDMETLFFHVRADLQASGRPVPQQRTRNDGRAIALARNRRRRTVDTSAAPSRVWQRPQFPDGVGDHRRWSPMELRDRLAALRESGDPAVAEQLLAAVAATCVDQYVAAVIGVLHDLGWHDDVRVAAAVACRRPPTDVADIVEALHTTERGELARLLLSTAARGPAEDIAGIAGQLRQRGQAGDLMILLDTVLGEVHASASLIGLVSALWLAGLREEVDQLLGRAAGRLPGSAVVDLADQLRAAGREEAAFGLYAAAPEALVGRPAEEIAQLCRSMQDAGAAEHGEKVVGAVMKTLDEPQATVSLAAALWDADLPQAAGSVVRRTASTSPIDLVVQVAAELRVVGRDAVALELCTTAVAGRRADEISDLVRALDVAGRPVDARTVLREAARRASITTIVELMDTNLSARQVLTAALAEGRDDLADLVVALNAQKPELAAAALIEIALQSGPGRDVSVVVTAISGASEIVKGQMVAGVLEVSGATEIAAILGALPAADGALLYAGLVRAGRLGSLEPETARSGSVVVPEDLVRKLASELPPRLIGSVLGDLWQAGYDDHARVFVNTVGSPLRSPVMVARTIGGFYPVATEVGQDQILAATLRSRSMHEVCDVITELHRLGRPDAIHDVLGWVQGQHGDYASGSLSIQLKKRGLHDYAGLTGGSLRAASQEDERRGGFFSQWRGRDA
ncbi:MAG TPA: caspase family protein [Pseudonocardiaceae bacterium]